MSAAFLQRFVDTARKDPARVLLHFYANANDVRDYSAAELLAMAQARAGAVGKLAAPGTLVFINSHDPLEQMAWWLGALVAGAVPGILTPPTAKLDKQKYYRDLAAILAAYPTAVVLYGSDIFDASVPLDARCHALACLALSSPETTVAARAGAMVFQQSSGTTGLRKGVLLNEAAVLAHMENYGRAIGISSDDVIVAWLPLYHDMGLVACLMQAIYWAVPLVLTSPFVWLSDAAWLVRATAQHHATLCWLPNFAFKYLADRIKPKDHAPDALTSLRMVVNCSEPVLPASLHAFRTALAPLGLAATAPSASYAMAENTFAVTQVPPGSLIEIETVDPLLLAEGRAVPRVDGRALAGSGQAVPDTRIQIRRDGESMSDGVVGQICVKSSYLMLGYVGVGAERGDVIDAGGWFATGDLGYLRSATLFVIGRSKDIIIRAGRNIDPAYLEASLADIAGIKAGRWAAFGIDNVKEGTEDIVILVEADVADPRALKNEIVKACNRAAGIPPQKVDIVPPNWLEKSSSGKISRIGCRTKYLQRVAAEGSA